MEMRRTREKRKRKMIAAKTAQTLLAARYVAMEMLDNC